MRATEFVTDSLSYSEKRIVDSKDFESVLNEIDRIDPEEEIDIKHHINMGDIRNRDYYSTFDRNRAPVPGHSDFIYTVKREDDDLEIIIGHPDSLSVVGFMELHRDEIFPLKNAHIVAMIGVDSYFQNKGIGTALYNIYLNVLGYPLISGREQTSAGRLMWTKLNNNPNIEVKGYIEFNDNKFNLEHPMDREAFDETIDRLMAAGAEYMGRVSRSHFFSFDVKKHGKELKTVVNRSIKLYGWNPHASVGLYARRKQQ